eukprot:GHVR01014976.1.p1 GENE.GHVR01014976.1~~GHVR01014976.1.p1  ORF type:complete len:137 (+),score=6.06 GHVR01014976.1:166-576(+)
MKLWLNHRDFMSHDFLRDLRQDFPPTLYSLQAYNQALIDIENKLISQGGKQLNTYGLPECDRCQRSDLQREIIRETSYDTQEMQRIVQHMHPILTQEQLTVYNIVMNNLNINSDTGKIFVYLFICFVFFIFDFWNY